MMVADLVGAVQSRVEAALSPLAAPWLLLKSGSFCASVLFSVMVVSFLAPVVKGLVFVSRRLAARRVGSVSPWAVSVYNREQCEC